MRVYVQCMTTLRIKSPRGALEAEFEQASPAEVVREIGDEAQRLLAGARLEDYIPVLVRRFAREHLLGRAA